MSRNRVLARWLLLGVILPALAYGQVEVLVDCDGGSVEGDGLHRGFYVPGYPGETLDRVDLFLGTETAGSYKFLLTAFEGSYHGDILGTARATLELTRDPANKLRAEFVFPSLSVTPGVTVAFRIDLESGPGEAYYAVPADDPGCPVIQTNRSAAPLDAFRRRGVRMRLYGTPDRTSSLIDCDLGETVDEIFRGFYIPEFAATALRRVDLFLGSPLAGAYTLTMTVNEGAYDGPLVGTSTTTIHLSSGIGEQRRVSFVFPSSPVSRGRALTFKLDLESGPGEVFYSVPVDNVDCPVVQTNGTFPPLDAARRDGVRIRVFAEDVTARLPATWGGIRTAYR